MGYITDYKLVKPDSFTEEETRFIIDNFEEFHKNRDILDDFESWSYSAKWYDFEEDMIKLSLAFPETIYIVDGDGEENGDIWRAYFKNGKMYEDRVNLVFPEYDESKLV